MDFVTATDRLTDCPSHADVAEASGVSVQTVRQARMDPDSPSYRKPPDGWKAAVAKLARERAEELTRLAEELEG